MAARAGGNGREGTLLHRQAPFGRGLLGIAAASTAVTMAVSEPPPGLDKATYLLSLSGVFFAGVIQVVASVQAVGGHAHAAGSKLVNACVVAPAVVAAGIAVASLLLQ